MLKNIRFFSAFAQRVQAVKHLENLVHAPLAQMLKEGGAARPYFQKFLKPGIDPQTVPWDSLSIDFLNDRSIKTQRQSPYRHCAFRYDAHFYFILGYQEELEKYGFALLGFRPSTRRGTLFIKQIQGIKLIQNAGRKIEDKIGQILKLFRWEKLLITIAEEWAAQNGFKRTAIRKARGNQYYNFYPYHAEKTRNLNQRLIMHYDITAQRMGYRNPHFRSRYRYKKMNIPPSKLRGT